MRGDSNATAGFFEDLSVLVFVLAGVSMLVGTYVWCTELGQGDIRDDELAHLAERYVTHVILAVQDSSAGTALPSLERIRSLDLSACADAVVPDRCYAASILLLHPCVETIVAAGSGLVSIPEATGHASELINAVDGRGLVVVAEVRCLVWQPQVV